MTLKDQFNNWITQLSNSEKPGKDITAFNFGLFETENGYTIYIIGAKAFDADDDDWATDVDFEPDDNYLPIDPAETKGLEWEQVLEKAKNIIEEFVKSEKFKDSILKDAKAITTGFDDGDLIRIK